MLRIQYTVTMDSMPLFNLNPDEGHEDEISRGAEQITLTRAGGEVLALDPHGTRITVKDEHAPLSQMNEDWGAVCEVFRQAVDTFAQSPDVALRLGDEIAIRYPGRAAALVLRVIEMENGRAKVTISTR